MIKFVLAVVAVVFVGLAYYAYTDKPNNIDVKTAVTEKEVSLSEEVSVATESRKVQKAEKSNSSELTEKNKVVKKQVKVKQNSEIEGKTDNGNTPEGIDNTDVSDTERQNESAYQHSLQPERKPELSEEEILKMIKEDLKEDSINK